MLYDLVIIGAGPAGISAAIHAKRLGLNFKLLERSRPGGQALSANLIENYPGFPKGISGRELMSRFLLQAKGLGIKITKCEAKKVRAGKNFLVRTNKGAYRARAVIVATGLKPIHIPLPLKKIYYYPISDKVRHRGKTVLVIGGGDSAFDEALSFSKKASTVTIAMRSNVPKALPKLVKRAKSSGILLKTGMNDKMLAKIKADIVVACIGKRPDLSILTPSLRGTLEPFDSPSTSLEAAQGRHCNVGTIFLAGDILHPNIRHIAAAAGDGVKAVEKIWGARLQSGIK